MLCGGRHSNWSRKPKKPGAALAAPLPIGLTASIWRRCSCSVERGCHDPRQFAQAMGDLPQFSGANRPERNRHFFEVMLSMVVNRGPLRLRGMLTPSLPDRNDPQLTRRRSHGDARGGGISVTLAWTCHGSCYHGYPCGQIYCRSDLAARAPPLRHRRTEIDPQLPVAVAQSLSQAGRKANAQSGFFAGLTLVSDSMELRARHTRGRVDITLVLNRSFQKLAGASKALGATGSLA